MTEIQRGYEYTLCQSASPESEVRTVTRTRLAGAPIN